MDEFDVPGGCLLRAVIGIRHTAPVLAEEDTGGTYGLVLVTAAHAQGVHGILCAGLPVKTKNIQLGGHPVFMQKGCEPLFSFCSSLRPV